jgi:hypothetical protein
MNTKLSAATFLLGSLACSTFAEALLIQAALIDASIDMTETFLIQSLLMALSIEGAKSDPALLDQVQKVIVKGARGLDLYQLSLTSQGFQLADK